LGRTVWYQADRRHYPFHFLGLIGPSNCGKGTTMGVGRFLARRVAAHHHLNDRSWIHRARVSGLGSAQGFIEQVMNPFKKPTARGYTLIPGAKEKRNYNELEEMDNLFDACRRYRDLEDMIRLAWDGAPMQLRTRSATGLRATGYSISIIGGTTGESLAAQVQRLGTSKVNGLCSRFYWCEVRQTRLLALEALRMAKRSLLPLVDRFAACVARARTYAESRDGNGAIPLTVPATQYYNAMSPHVASLSQTIHCCSKALPMILRMALTLAVFDDKQEDGLSIRLPHVQAAFSLWGYLEQCARRRFGLVSQTVPPVEGEKLGCRLLKILRARAGISRGELPRAVGPFGPERQAVTSEELQAALDMLVGQGKARCEKARTPGKPGPAAERWFAL
jgi:hypothetical protein